MGRWSWKGPRGKGLNAFFLSGSPKDAGQPGKKEGLEGSREVGGGELIMHKGGEEEREVRGAKPCWNGTEGVLLCRVVSQSKTTMGLRREGDRPVHQCTTVVDQ